MNTLLRQHASALDSILKNLLEELSELQAHQGDWFALKCAAYRLMQEIAAREKRAIDAQTSRQGFSDLEREHLQRLWLVSSVRQHHNLIEKAANVDEAGWRSLQYCYLALAQEAEQIANRASDAKKEH